MVKFLELSPDVRKAALSLGLTPHQDCVVCLARISNFRILEFVRDR